MKEYILITGASSGIGYEMALQLAAKKHNLILVARSTDKLIQLQKTISKNHVIEVEIFTKDLSLPEKAIELYNDVKTNGLLVTHLVNNAGFGDYGKFTQTHLSKELDMINLNVSSLVILTKLFAQDMEKRKFGRIMNVASILSFLPFPYYSVYSATKTFVLAFSETIAAELEGTGVIVTTLCPGTVETDFHTFEMRKTNAMSTNKPMPASVVAADGVKLLLSGKGKKIVGFNNWFISNLPRFTPDGIMMKIKKNLASIKK
ncbi:MAG: SDR family NAD(P)-dependent oxidoreductase [Luteibaculaceae bacterium]